MSEIDRDRLVDLFRDADVGWYFDYDVDVRAVHVNAKLDELSSDLSARFGRRIDALADILDNPRGFTPLVQTLVMPMTTPIRAMVYCVLRGAKVTALRYEYAIERQSKLRVVVEFPRQQLEFESDELWDAEALHHFGFAKLNGAPFVDGYFGFAGR